MDPTVRVNALIRARLGGIVPLRWVAVRHAPVRVLLTAAVLPSSRSGGEIRATRMVAVVDMGVTGNIFSAIKMPSQPGRHFYF